MRHDAAGPVWSNDRPATWTPFREAVVAFPVSHASESGDFPTYMYADDSTYIAMSRETMGWPVRDGLIEIQAEPNGGPAVGTHIGGRLARAGRTIMRVDLTLTGSPRTMVDEPPPRWLALKVIPDVMGPRAAMAQLVATGPQRIHHRVIWPANASLAFEEGDRDELHFLAPRAVERAEYWTEIDLTIGWGNVLAELGDEAWGLFDA